jgi:hypothetical protein
MKKTFLIGLLLSTAGCAGWPTLQNKPPSAQRWQGFLVRNGLDVPIEVVLAKADRDWTGELRVGKTAAHLENVRLTDFGIRFELPGEGTFEGTVAGNSMAGSISGAPSRGGFALTREAEPMFADPITSSGP